MDSNKICFIACTNDELKMKECNLYIDRLYVPEGFTTEKILITDAKSMCEGYNRAMTASDAKYKIYLHQDVYIINRWFLHNLIRIFESDKKIGLIGMVGASSLSDEAVMWRSGEGTFFGRTYDVTDTRDFVEEKIEGRPVVEDAVSVDGQLMATSVDIPWREDLFREFDFYDVSQSFEIRKKGYRVVVPAQEFPWVVHDDGLILSLYNYNKNRKIFIENYKGVRRDDGQELSWKGTM